MKGHIRRTGKNSWSIVLYLGRTAEGKPKYRWQSIKGGRKDAERELARQLNSIHSGCFVEPTKLTMAAFLEYWLENHARPSVGAKTLERYVSIINLDLIPGIGHHTLARLTPLHVQSFYAQALSSGRKNGRGGLSGTTVRHIHGLLRQALQAAVRLQLVARNVADAVQPPKKARTEMRVLNQEEVGQLLKAAQGTALHLPILVLVTCGLRRGELCGLRWGDLDLKAGTLSVQQSVQQTHEGVFFAPPKTATSRRTVLIPATIVEALRRHKARQSEHRLRMGPAYKNLDLVFAALDGGPTNPYALTDGFRRLAQRVGIRAHLHTLRHTHCTQMLILGTHPKIAAERMGHSSPSFTMSVYQHAAPTMQQELVDKLDRLLREDLEQKP